MEIILSLIGLTALQIVLGIDNVIFLSIVTSKLDEKTRNRARKIGVLISMCMNAILISLAGFLTNMHEEVFSLFGKSFNVHDLVMVIGGFFLVFKAVKELYHKIEMKNENKPFVNVSMFKIVLTMSLIDLVFSIDSTITAVGMSDIRWIQITSTLSAIAAMFFFFVPLNKFIEKHPSFNVLALAFLVMIGFALFVDGMGIELPKSYVYSTMLFAILMEVLNIRFDKNRTKKEVFLKFNVNDHIKVKLTEAGLRCWIENENRYIKQLRETETTLEELKSRSDENGYHEFQLWCFMEIFGEKMSNGMENLFENDVLFNQNDFKR